MRRHPAALLTAACLLGPPAASARAAALSDLPDCVRPGGFAMTTPSGFTEGAGVDLFFDDAPYVGPFTSQGQDPNADPDGTVSGGTFDTFFLSAPAMLPPGQLSHDYVLRATERPPAAQSATTTVHVAQLGVALPTARMKLGAIVTPHVTGFPQADRLYAHYALRSVPKATTALGTTSMTACDGLTVRTHALPVKHPTPGEWLLQIDENPKFDRATPTNVRMQISVGRTGLHFHPVVATHPVVPG